MEIRNLNTFLRVAALKNFTKAAAELGYSQPNVSMQIRQLEEELGAPLFDRVGKRVVLTQTGEDLVPYARAICENASKVRNMFKDEASLTGTIRVGMTDSLSELFPGAAFAAYHERFPNVQVEIPVDTTVMLLSRLRTGELDAACVISEPLPDEEWTILHEIRVPVIIAANPALPIAAKKRPTLADVSKEHLVLCETTAPYDIQFEHTLRDRRLPYRPTFRMESAAMACRLTEQAPFVCVLPSYTLNESLRAGRLKALDIPGWDHYQSVQIVMHAARTLTPQIEGFLTAMNDTLTADLT